MGSSLSPLQRRRGSIFSRAAADLFKQHIVIHNGRAQVRMWVSGGGHKFMATMSRNGSTRSRLNIIESTFMSLRTGNSASLTSNYFLGVLYHLPDMIRALQMIRQCCGHTLFVKTRSENDFCRDRAALAKCIIDALKISPMAFLRMVLNHPGQVVEAGSSQGRR
jgi:hypothetical protein